MKIASQPDEIFVPATPSVARGHAGGIAIGVAGRRQTSSVA